MSSGSSPKPYTEMTRRDIEAMAPQQKTGSKSNGTDGAHKLSHELAKSIINSTPGPKPTVGAAQLVTAMQSAPNIRIKSTEGNRVTDRQNDAAIAAKHQTGERLTQREAARAVQAYKGGSAVSGQSKTLDRVTNSIGEMRVDTGKPGQPPKVKNLAKK